MAGSVGTKLTPGQHVYDCFASKDNIYQKCDVIALKGYCLTRLGLANKNVSRFEIVTLYSVIFLKVKFYIPNIFHRRKIQAFNLYSFEPSNNNIIFATTQFILS